VDAPQGKQIAFYRITPLYNKENFSLQEVPEFLMYSNYIYVDTAISGEVLF
jgi:hypothetical protein